MDVLTNDALKVYVPVEPGSSGSDEAFRRQVDAALRTAVQPEINKTAAAYDEKLESLKRKIEKQQDVVAKRQDDLGGRRAEQISSYVDLASSLFTRRKRSISTPISKGRMTRQAENELKNARKALDDLNQQWQSLLAERQAALQRISADWQMKAGQAGRVQVTPFRKDVFASLLAVVWTPYYRIKGKDGVYEVRAWVG